MTFFAMRRGIHFLMEGVAGEPQTLNREVTSGSTATLGRN